MTRMNVHLSDQQIAALKKAAQRTGLTVAELIRRAIDDKYPSPPRRPRQGTV